MNGAWHTPSCSQVQEALLVTRATVLSDGEALIEARLVRLGFGVTAKAATEVNTSDASGVNLVVVCSEAAAAEVGAKFRLVTIPVVILNGDLFASMDMATQPNRGVSVDDQSSIRILNAAHPLAAGLSDVVQVCDPCRIAFGRPCESAIKVAHLPGQPERWVLFGYEVGAKLVERKIDRRVGPRHPRDYAGAQNQSSAAPSGPLAPARRVGLFFGDEVAEHATPDGWSLFVSAVCWAAGREALLAVGSVNPMSAGDTNIRARLQELGYAVELRDSDQLCDFDTVRKSVIVVSSTADPKIAKSKFRHLPTPVVVLSGELFAAMGMTEKGIPPGQDPVLNEFHIVQPGHPMTVGCLTRIRVCNEPSLLFWGRPCDSATVIATQVRAPGKVVMFGYKTGSKMTDIEAPDRRVGLSFSEQAAASATEAGWLLFGSAVSWAVDDRDKEVLFVVASTQVDPSDQRIKERLEGLCYSVTIKDWEGAFAEYLRGHPEDEIHREGYALVIISSSVMSPNALAQDLRSALLNLRIPVLSMSANTYPTLGMTGPGFNVEYGSTNANEITIADPHHSMAAGFIDPDQSRVSVSDAGVPMAWADLSARRYRQANIVATLADGASRAVVFGYEVNRRMHRETAPARRVGLFFNGELAMCGAWPAWELFDSAVNWAAGRGLMSFSDVFIEEWQEILERRRLAYGPRASKRQCTAPENLVGLALSGGGIRSATFSLGVLQALSDLKLLGMFDYLSTVSGGGYLGGWLSAWLSREDRNAKNQLFPKTEDIEPNRASQYVDPSSKQKKAEGSMCAGIDPIHHLRLFANYLTPRKGALSGDTWRAIAVVSRNLIMTWLIMVPVILSFVLFGQLYFVLQQNSITSFFFPFWQSYEKVLSQRKDYANDFAGISLDKEKQDKFEQTAEYLASRSPINYERTARLLRKVAINSSEEFSDAEYKELKSFSAFLSGKSRRSEEQAELENLTEFIAFQSAGGYKNITRDLREDGLDYISRYLPPKPEYEERKKEIARLISYFKYEEPLDLSISPADTVDPDVTDSVNEWVRALSAPIDSLSIADDGRPAIEDLANYLSAISQKRIIDLRKELSTQSLNEEDTKVVDKIIEEATAPLRQKHKRDLSDRAFLVILPVFPILGWIALMIVLWMRSGLPGYVGDQLNSRMRGVRGAPRYAQSGFSWDYLAHGMGGVVVALIALFAICLFTAPSRGLMSTFEYLVSLVRGRSLLTVVVVLASWLVVALALWHYIKPWSDRPPSNADHSGVVEWWKEVRRNKIERVHSTLLVMLVIIGGVLVLSGFGHEIVDYVWFDPRPKKWLTDYVAKAGGWAALIAAIAGSIYTAVKASPTGGEDSREPGSASIPSRLIFAVTPPLVVVILTIVAAWASHRLISQIVSGYDLNKETGDFPPLTLSVLVGVILCLHFATYEMNRRKGARLPALFFLFCFLEVLAGAFLCVRQNLRIDKSQHWMLVLFVLLGGGLIFFRLMVNRIDRSDRTSGPKLSEQFMIRVLAEELGKNRVWLLVAASVGLPLVALLPATRLIADGDPTTGILPPLTICSLVGIALCVTFFLYEVVNGVGNNRRSLWLVTASYVALCALFVFSFYRNYGSHKSVMLGHAALGLLAMTATWVIALGWMADPNRLSLHTFYRARLVRAYMGASNPERHKKDREITESVSGDDVLLRRLRNCQRGGPYHIVNTTLSLVGGRDLTTAQRSAAVFAMTKRYCGSARTGYRHTEDYMGGRLMLGTSVAVSGAAVSPNMGAKNPTAFLAMLMTLLNIRLGYWAPNPSKEAWQEPQARLWPFYMLQEFLSQTNDVATYCYLTDGAHFDNTGLYSLVERGCRYILLVDNGQDPLPCFQDLGDAIRRCRIDFGAEIKLDLTPLLKTKSETLPRQYSGNHFVIGDITYSIDQVRRLKWKGDIDNDSRRKGIIILIKPTLAQDETADVRQYGLENTDFPQHKTSDQWFDETQFESYRRLGELSVRKVFDEASKSGGIPPELSLDAVEQIFERVKNDAGRPQPVVPGTISAV